MTLSCQPGLLPGLKVVARDPIGLFKTIKNRAVRAIIASAAVDQRLQGVGHLLQAVDFLSQIADVALSQVFDIRTVPGAVVP